MEGVNSIHDLGALSRSSNMKTNVSSIGKNNLDFFQNFRMISLAKKRKKRKW